MRSYLVYGCFLGLSLSACKTSNSTVKATNEFSGKKLSYWYENLNFREGDPYNFLSYHQENRDVLLGNRDGDLVPDTLKGLWFMDGNPLTDKTIQFAKVYPGKTRFDILIKVGDPLNFSWTNISKSHSFNDLINKFSYEYEISFLDCPADVKKEREVKWGMKDGSCKQADRQFATITPFVTVAGLRRGVPKNLAYFDMYLRPQEGDYLVWERRSNVLKLVDEVAAAFNRNKGSDGWHRYKFTQILDKQGRQLQSYPRFFQHIQDFAAEQNVAFNDLLFYKCYEGKTGCSQEAIVESEELSDSFTGEEGANLFGSLPFF